MNSYPAFSFARPLTGEEVDRLIAVAQKFNLELRYWQSRRKHIFPIASALDREIDGLALGPFMLGFPSAYEWDACRQGVLYRRDHLSCQG